MSKRLQDRVENFIIKTGKNARTMLADAADVSPGTIDNVRGKRSGNHTPSAPMLYRIALAVGFTEDEALQIAREREPIKAKVG